MGKKKNGKIVFTFCIIVGVFYYLIPFSLNGEITMIIPLVENFILGLIPNPPLVTLIIIGMLVLVTIIVTLFCKKKNLPQWCEKLFKTSIIGLILRVGGIIVGTCAYLKVGPEFIWSEYTGEVITYMLMPSLLVIFFLALVPFPILTEFGAMEVLGGIFQRLMKPLFKLRGSASVFPFICWIGSGTSGMILVDREHKEGRISAREAQTIVFGFGIISLPVTLIYCTELAGLKLEFFPLLILTCIITGIVATLIMVRIPPLSKASTKNIDGKEISEMDNGKMSVKETVSLGIEKASNGPSVKTIGKKGILSVSYIYVEVFPIIYLIATLILAISEFTPAFDILGAPIAPVLTAVGLPEAEIAAPNLLIGFADTLLPFLGAGAIESDLTKFVVCAVAIYQGYCMSEGALVLKKSSMKISYARLIVVFIQKTIICIPIAIIIGKIFGLS